MNTETTTTVESVTMGEQEVMLSPGPLCEDGSTIDDLFTSFLRAKFLIGKSEETVISYSATIRKFRTHLLTHGLDILPACPPEDLLAIQKFRSTIREQINTFSATGAKPGVFVAARTRNRIVGTISSLYAHGLSKGMINNLIGNPADMVERSRVQRKSNARVIELVELVEKLQALMTLPQKKLEDQRDLALLLVLFFTGSRIDAILQLRARHLEIKSDGTIVLFLEYMKRGKQDYISLTPVISSYLVSYLQAAYGVDAFTIKGEQAVWISQANGYNDKSLRKWEALGRPKYLPLEYEGARYIMKKRLGITRLHVVRYTFNKILRLLGASIEQRKELLNHDDIKTTQIYDEVAEKGENPFANDIERALLYGILPVQKEGKER